MYIYPLLYTLFLMVYKNCVRKDGFSSPIKEHNIIFCLLTSTRVIPERAKHFFNAYTPKQEVGKRKPNIFLSSLRWLKKINPEKGFFVMHPIQKKLMECFLYGSHRLLFSTSPPSNGVNCYE